MLKQMLISLALLGFFLNPTFAALDIPEPVGVVNDFANILSDSTESEITTLIESVKESNGVEIAVVTIESLEGYEINEYAVEMGRSWGIGNEERDDGVLFLTSVGDRQTYIATGYGVEGYITDIQAHWITEYEVVPYFKDGDYDAGILAGTKKIANAVLEIEALPNSAELVSSQDYEDILATILLWAIFLFSFLFPWLFAVLGRSKRWWPGGVAGGIFGSILWYFFGVIWFGIIGFSILGFLFDYFASSNYKKGKDNWWTGGGSSGWGGGGSFGGGSSGGFGGFSGGSFGGGGGGSSW